MLYITLFQETAHNSQVANYDSETVFVWDEEGRKEMTNGKAKDTAKVGKDDQGQEGRKNNSKKVVVLPTRILPPCNKQKSKHTSSPYTSQVGKPAPAKNIVKGKKQKKITKRIKAAGNPDKMIELFNWLESDRLVTYIYDVVH